MSFNFMAAVTIYSDSEAQENKICHCFHFFPIFAMMDAMILAFWMLSFKPAFSLSSFTFIKRLFSSSSLSAIRVTSYAYQSLLFLPAILIPPCDSSNPAFGMRYSECRPSQVAQKVKCLPAMWETQVWSLDWEDPLKKEMATHSSTLAWKIPWRKEPGRLQSMGLQRVGHDWATSHSTYKLNKQGNNIQPWCTPSNFEPVHYSMSGSNCCFLFCIQFSQETGKVIWYSHLFKNFPPFAVINCQRL